MELHACLSCGSGLETGWRFCPQCGLALDGSGLSVGTAGEAGHRDERRHVAVLFADVSGFTKLSATMDAESVHDLMNEVFAGLGDAIREEGGHVDKYIGDNVMALFGAPVSYGDDAARACRAALHMQAFLRRFAESTQDRLGVTLQMRIGINYGLVVAGDVGSDVKRQYTVMGDTVNVASRLESSAAPGTTYASRSVRDAAESQFAFGAPMQLSVKGKSEPIEAFELIGESVRVGPAEVETTSTLVGREAEVSALRSALDRAGGPGRWVLISGEAGIGKTRLVGEAEAMAPGLRALRVATTSSTRRRPFGLARRIVRESLAECAGQTACLEDPERFAEALSLLGAELASFHRTLWYLAAPTLITVEPPDPDPQSLRRMIEAGVRSYLGGLAAKRPELALFIDPLDDADDGSLELLATMRASRGGLPLSFICAMRESAQRGLRVDATIALGPLGHEDATDLLDELLKGTAVGSGARTRLLRRASGVPRFIEELARFVRAAGAEFAEALERGEEEEALPATLASALTSRIDRLDGSMRDLLCQCAVQGVEFSATVAQRVRESPPWHGASTGAVLQACVASGMVAVRQPDIYEFTPAVLRDACYGLLLRRSRRALHAHVADVLCELAGGAQNVSASLLTIHEARGERWGRAAAAALRAGERAADQFVNDQAIDFYERALRYGSQSGGEPPAPGVICEAHAGLSRTRLLVGDPAGALAIARAMGEAAETALERGEARRLEAAALARTGQTVESTSILQEVAAALGATDEEGGAQGEAPARVLYDLASLHLRAGRLEAARQCVIDSRQKLPQGDAVGAARSDLLEGKIAHARGDFADAKVLYGRARSAASRAGSLSQLAHAENGLGICARDEGRYDEARTHFEEALASWTRTGDDECIAGAHNNLANLAISQGDYDESEREHREALEASRRGGNARGMALAHVNLAILALERDDWQTGAREAQDALRAVDGSADGLITSITRVILGESLLTGGDVAEAAKCFESVRADSEAAGNPLAAAGASRGMGRVLLARGEASAAATELRTACEAYRGLKRAQEECRTQLWLARALAATGDTDGARSCARDAQARFIQIHARHDCQRAAALLRELGEG